jgi:HSP20 family protein
MTSFWSYSIDLAHCFAPTDYARPPSRSDGRNTALYIDKNQRDQPVLILNVSATLAVPFWPVRFFQDELKHGSNVMTSLLPSLWGRSDDDNKSLSSLQREIDKVFEDFGRGFGMTPFPRFAEPANRMVSPSMDVKETDKTFELTAELPGVSEKDVEVTIADNMLTIRGEKKAEKKEEKDDYHMVERTYGSFQRTLRLPFDAKAEDVDAQFKDGVLKVILTKPPEVAAKTQKVEIKTSAG